MNHCNHNGNIKPYGNGAYCSQCGQTIAAEAATDKTLVEKVEDAKGKTFGALADSTEYNAGIDKAISIIRQHESQAKKVSLKACALAMQKDFPIMHTGIDENGKWGVRPLEFELFV